MRHFLVIQPEPDRCIQVRNEGVNIVYIHSLREQGMPLDGMVFRLRPVLMTAVAR